MADSPGFLTLLCREYRAGRIGWDDVVREVGRVRPRVEVERDQFWSLAIDHRVTGSWRELELARDDGLLTGAEYQQLVAERDRGRYG